MKHKDASMRRSPRETKMIPVSESLARLAADLRQEVEQWPGVVVKRAFGMLLVYRGEVVFAALPGTRTLYEEDAILIKFQRENASLAKRMAQEKRFAAGTMADRAKKKQGQGTKWRIFLLREDRDAGAAVEWLARAYEAARRAETR